jgi:hypothetical protein
MLMWHSQCFFTSANTCSVITSVALKWRYLQLGKRKVTGEHVTQVGLWLGDDSHFVLIKNFLMKSSVLLLLLLLCNNQFTCRQNLERSIHMFSRCHHETLQEYWVFGLLGWILWEQSSGCQKIIVMLLTLLSSCLSISGLSDFGLFHSNTVYSSFYLPQTLGIHHVFSEIFTTFYVYSLLDPSKLDQARF